MPPPSRCCARGSPASDFSPRSDIGYAIHNLGTVVGAAEQMAVLASADAGAAPKPARRSPLAPPDRRALRPPRARRPGRARAAARRRARPRAGRNPAAARQPLRPPRRHERARSAHYDAAAKLLPGDQELALRRGKVLHRARPLRAGDRGARQSLRRTATASSTPGSSWPRSRATSASSTKPPAPTPRWRPRRRRRNGPAKARPPP